MTISKRVIKGRAVYYQWIVSYKPFKSISLGTDPIINKDNCKVVKAMIILSLLMVNLVKEAIRIAIAKD